jgi:GNAT superfamily N-acetyltransferase
MNKQFNVTRTTTSDADFIQLVDKLDSELWNELNEDMNTYDQYNKVPDIKTAIIIYDDVTPVAIGCYKEYDTETVEIKRMYVDKAYRGKGISKLVLKELEQWAIESGFQYSILETSIYFDVAQTLYKQAGYDVIPNYHQYEGLEESVCMRKKLT